ncbi:MAG: RNA helicase, partial [Betaproteobacteria bacterium HGW-Betaproteobacteria-21]
VNFELPNVPEDYVHRIGRTGRAGATGNAISLVDREEVKMLADIERVMRRKIDRVTAEGFVPSAGAEEAHDADQRREPMPRRGGGGGRSNQDRKPANAPATRNERPAGRGPANGGQPASRAPQRARSEADGNRARPANAPRTEVDGNRSAPNRPEANGNNGGNRNRPEANGNRAPQPSERRSPAPRAALFSARTGNGNR